MRVRGWRTAVVGQGPPGVAIGGLEGLEEGARSAGKGVGEAASLLRMKMLRSTLVAALAFGVASGKLVGCAEKPGAKKKDDDKDKKDDKKKDDKKKDDKDKKDDKKTDDKKKDDKKPS